MELKGTTALLTGGARIGRVVAEALAERGCSIALTWRSSRDSAEETARSVQKRGARAAVIQADLAEPQSAPAVVEATVRELGRLDALVCMASHYEKTAFDRLDDEAWRRNIDADLGSVYRLALAAAPHLKAHGAGRIVAFADWLPASGRPRYKGYLPYYVAKAGVVGLVEALALEMAPTVLVNAIAPGPILKPPGFSDEADREVVKATPLGRWGGPEEIARAVVFLLETGFVTGECLRVDGGRHLN